MIPIRPVEKHIKLPDNVDLMPLFSKKKKELAIL